MGKYQLFEPGVYTPEERSALERCEQAMKALPLKQPGSVQTLNPYELQWYNSVWSPYDPLYNDRDYAVAHGHRDIPALPRFVLPEVPMGFVLRGLGDEFFYTAYGGEVEVFQQSYAGDQIRVQAAEYTAQDVTVPGSDVRRFEMTDLAEAIDEEGKVVATQRYLRGEGYRTIADGSPKPSAAENAMAWLKDFPPIHVTTDEEWDKIIDIWRHETIRGDKPLYWEDVQVGDEPQVTCSGPISYMHMIGFYGWKYGRRNIMLRPQIMDPQVRPHLDRDPYGQYWFLSGHFGNQNVPECRMLWFNDTGCNLLIRMVTNWMGDAGFISRVTWAFRPFAPEMVKPGIGGDVLNKVPYMQGKECTRHGGEGDTAICKGYVTEKFVDDQGSHKVRLSTWCESLDGDILQVSEFDVVLPTKKK